ncbi:SMP-30/Gluconolaconase/LRE-like region-domain-containing protein [Gautieria morchelliformis]|nr:SMP-30/Gluconolaconase/LRE-like region-domain-containing protein [Gautieria morchelliformis]
MEEGAPKEAPEYDVKLLCKTQCVLGESPLYEPATSILHFVDILKYQVLHYNVLTSELTMDQLDQPIGCIAFRRDGKGLAYAAHRGFAVLEPGPPPQLRYLSEPLPEFQRPYTRFNDGACDLRGRFVAGTIFHREKPAFSGALYSFDPETGENKILDEDGITDANGLGWSADSKTLYFTNSLLNQIYAYDYDLATGNISNRRVFIDAIAEGLPSGTFCDGLCLDDEGGIWSARWNGGSIARFRGEDGSLDFVVHIPGALNVTACTFGGPNNDLLYVTTAHCNAIPGSGDPTKQVLYPDSGNLFVVDFHGRYRGGKWRFEFAG